MVFPPLGRRADRCHGVPPTGPCFCLRVPLEVEPFERFLAFTHTGHWLRRGERPCLVRLTFRKGKGSDTVGLDRSRGSPGWLLCPALYGGF